MKTIISIVILLFPFMQEQDKWPEHEKKAFIKSCKQNVQNDLTEEQAKTYCSCMLEKVIEKYPTPEEANKLTTGEIQSMAVDCMDI